MSNKLDISEVANAVELALTTSQLDANTAQIVKNNILKQLRAVVEENTEEDEGEKEPRQKNQYVIMVSDPKKLITEDLTGWIFQMPEEEAVVTIKDKIHMAMYDFNASKKGQKNPMSTIGEGLEYVSGRFFKEYGVKLKNKTPVLVVTTDNILPKDNTNKV